jgi:hypothetical protein
MDNQHCTECGTLISYGLRCGDMIFCNDECAERFGIDPQECFFSDASADLVCGSDPDDDCIHYS